MDPRRPFSERCTAAHAAALDVARSVYGRPGDDAARVENRKDESWVDGGCMLFSECTLANSRHEADRGTTQNERAKQ